jgi:hypothetical protein
MSSCRTHGCCSAKAGAPTKIGAALKWLRRENARGAHIFVRPHGAHGLSLIDDLDADAIGSMKEVGISPDSRPGFTNQKPSRRLASGLPPFVRLREWNGRSYDQGEDFLNQIVPLATAACIKRQSHRTSTSFIGDSSVRALAAFHDDRRYCGDLRRADVVWALYAVSHGLSEAEIESKILRARDLSKKGGFTRQLGYAERTATKAITAARRTDP